MATETTSPGRLVGVRLIYGVTGSIAAFRAAEILRDLREEGAQVRVMMTRAAAQFVTPTTFKSLSGNEVLSDLFPAYPVAGEEHIELSEWGQAIVIAPATANLIGKVVHGIADDLVSTVIMASDCPCCFAPAMHYRMYNNPIFQANVQRLKEGGYWVVDAEYGQLANLEQGLGRLAATERIVDTVVAMLRRKRDLVGKQVLITAGPTVEAIDPVRVITNRSSGKMGYAIASAARDRGATVTLISGPTNLPQPQRVPFVAVTTAEELRQAVRQYMPATDILVMAAAVADFRPTKQAPNKIKKETREVFVLELEKTPDILAEARVRSDQILVGFALETDNELAHARRKLERKKLDLIVLNNPLVKGSGFGGDTNQVTLIDRQGRVEALPTLSKIEVAHRIFDWVRDNKR